MTSHFFLQQSKLVAKAEKQKGSAFAKSAGLSEKAIAELKERGVDVDNTKVGELNSAYSMQAMSANLLVEKQKQNDSLLAKKYRARTTKALTLAPSATGAAPTKGKVLDENYRVEVLEERHAEKKVKVRDLFGNEGWTDADALAY